MKQKLKKKVNFRIVMSRAEANVKRASLEVESDDDLLDTSSMEIQQDWRSLVRHMETPIKLILTNLQCIKSSMQKKHQDKMK